MSRRNRNSRDHARKMQAAREALGLTQAMLDEQYRAALARNPQANPNRSMGERVKGTEGSAEGGGASLDARENDGCAS